MLILLVIFAVLHARAAPLTGGPATEPTIIHAILFGIHPREDGSDTTTRTLYPDREATFWGKLGVRAKITIYAVIAPEMMIWWAMRQRFGAVKIARDINELKPELKWSQTHGQFIQMGGFVRKDTMCVLFPPQIIKLVKEGRIDTDQLNVAREDIEDKSKGDMLSKGLVAFQTSWFIFECLTRLHQKLLLLEVEVVTLAFAVLNIITYGLWWFKPLNVNRPFYIHVRPTAAIVGVQSTPNQGRAGEQTDPLEGFIIMTNDANAHGSPRSTENPFVRARNAIQRKYLSLRQEFYERPWWQTLGRWIFRDPFTAIVMPLIDLFEEAGTPDLATHVPTFYGMDIPGPDKHLIQILAPIIGIMFGAIHFLSWDAVFPSERQLLWWMISSIILIAEPTLILLAGLAGTLGDTLEDDTYFQALVSVLLAILAGVSVTVGVLAYILARFCVLVLAFMTLEDLPPRALDAVSWTSYIPHL